MLGGRYRLDHLLGRGGMGTVWAGYDTILNRPVAVKMLRDDLGTETEVQRERLRAEARSAAAVRHPNLAATFDAVVHEDTFAIVMERLPGPSLADRLDDGPLTANEVRAVGLDLLAALDAVHEAGLVHRDVKPANVLRSTDGRWKLVDFGIAKDLLGDLSLTQTGTTLGTPAYLAPELLRGEATTPSADLWAVGVTLYQALTGQLPFSGDTPFAIAYAVQAAQPEPLSTLLPDTDRRVVDTIERALHKSPEDRFPSAEAMAASLVARPEPAVSAPPLILVEPPPAPAPLASMGSEDVASGEVADHPAEPPGRRSRRGRTMALAAASLAVVVVAMLTLGGGPDDGGTGRLEDPAAADERDGSPASSVPADPVSGSTDADADASPRSGRTADRSTSGRSTNGRSTTDPSTSVPDGPSDTLPSTGTPPTTAPGATDPPGPGPGTPDDPDDPAPPTTSPSTTAPPTTAPPTTAPTTTSPLPTLPELPLPLPLTLPDLLTDSPLLPG
jgi:serine/threonine-protein kinase